MWFKTGVLVPAIHYYSSCDFTISKEFILVTEIVGHIAIYILGIKHWNLDWNCIALQMKTEVLLAEYLFYNTKQFSRDLFVIKEEEIQSRTKLV